jgi:hypothetical protein
MSRPTRPMTPDEVRMARALGRCSFTPATFDKRFARDIAARAEKPEPTITEAGAACLRAKVHRYRRQIAADVVALAGPLPNPEQVETSPLPPDDAQRAVLEELHAAREPQRRTLEELHAGRLLSLPWIGPEPADVTARTAALVQSVG